MKFLVILFALLANYLWLKDLDRFDDGWFFRFRRRVENSVGAFAGGASGAWLPGLVIIYSVPIVTLLVLLTLVQGQAFGLPTMLLHIVVLLVALDRTQPGHLAKDFLDEFASGNLENCRVWLKKELRATEETDLGDQESIGKYFRRKMTYRCFERMFVMYFWYLLTGPAGVLFSYISYQLRDSHRADQQPDEVAFVRRVIAVLEWAPLRLLALTFSLAGNFVSCFNRIRKSFWSFPTETDSAEMLYGYATCALSGLTAEEDGGDEAIAMETEHESSRNREAQRIEALQSLLERSQAIWLALLAIGTIFALP